MDFHAFAIVCVFVVLDVASGLLKAASSGALSSAKMREGAGHKATILLIMVMAYAIDYSIGYIDLGVPAIVAPGFACYFFLQEVTSILENASAVNPELDNTRLFGMIFGGRKDEEI